MTKAPLVALLAALQLATVSPALSAAESPKLPTTTRKIVLEKTDTGYRWKLIQAPVSALGEHQVLIRVRAVALNRGDLEMLEPDAGNDHSGLVVASDAAGDVVAVGSQVQGLQAGARVTSLYFKNWTDGPPNDEKMSKAHGATVDGVLGEYIVLDDTAVAPVPSSLTYEEAATLATAGLTGWMASTGHRAIQPGDVVLVQGTGGVSMFALQFAAAQGARVIATSSSNEKLDRAKAFGADEVINYKQTPAWPKRVMELTERHGADVVVDVGGKATLPLSVESLAYNGTLSIVGGLTGYGGEIPALGLLLKTASAQGIYVGSRADYLRMCEFISKHQIHPVIDRVFPLEQYDEALKHMASGNFVGKIVLRF